MYEYSIEKFGSFEKHIIHNSLTNNGFEIVPEQGAVLLSAIFSGINVIEGYTNPEDLAKLSWSKSIVLYPFPNRLDAGKYTFEGKNYVFPINNAATGNAIHGLGKDKVHRVSSIITAKHYASITCTFEYDGSEEYYPFPFRFEIEFFISDGNAMEIKMTFANTGESNLPVGIGWHPYFSISENIADTEMQLPELQWIEITDRMLPTGEKRPYSDFATLRPIGETNLDNGFFIANQNEPFGLTLKSEKGTLRYWQEIGEDKYNYIQIFTPPHRTCVALEPMTANIDAFNNGDGLKILQATETLSGTFGFSFLKNN